MTSITPSLPAVRQAVTRSIADHRLTDQETEKLNQLRERIRSSASGASSSGGSSILA